MVLRRRTSASLHFWGWRRFRSGIEKWFSCRTLGDVDSFTRQLHELGAALEEASDLETRVHGRDVQVVVWAAVDANGLPAKNIDLELVRRIDRLGRSRSRPLFDLSGGR